MTTLDTDTNGHEPPKTFRRSDTIAALITALAKAQGGMTGAKKDSDNPFFRSKYADLASVWDAIRTPLSTNGLAVLQFPRSTPEGVEVETLLAHESGEWFAETLSLPVGKYDSQGVGSAITYARRYGLQSIVGIAPEDDDGNAAAKSAQFSADANGGAPRDRARADAARAANPPTPIIYRSEDQLTTLAQLGRELGLKQGDVLNRYDIKRLANLTAENAAEVILDYSRKRITALLAELALNLDDVRMENPLVVGDLPDDLDQDACNTALSILRRCKATAEVNA